MKYTDGGVTAAKGFTAAGIHCGVKSSNRDKKDVALVFAEVSCNATAVYTTNVVKAAPLQISRRHLENNTARAIIVNSGNANACAPNGEEHATAMCKAAAAALGVAPEDVIVASTGVIGQELNIKVITEGVPALASSLSVSGGTDAAEAIMTTDLTKKEFAIELELGGKTVRLGGMAKGSGMIHPNMGTMLCFITTDAAISAGALQKALLSATRVSFNRVSVDGDTSTNDFCTVLASGLAENAEITEDSKDYALFCEALESLCVSIARSMAADGEGATHLITCVTHGAKSEADAETIGKSVIRSPLLKCAVFGMDANWGRVLAAMGYSGAEFDPEKCSVTFRSGAGEVMVCKNGRGLTFDEGLAKRVLSEKEVVIDIDMAEGEASAICWGCDLSYDYVKINGDYRT